MASLHDVAKLAGVSKSTVSRVVNNEYGVKQATKDKVKKVIDELGYQTNLVAKELKSQKTNLIGVIVPRVASSATSQGVDGLSRVFDNAGKQVLLASTQQSFQKEIEFIRLFNQKRVEGIILYATHLDEELVEVILQSAAPVVLVGQDGSLFNIPSIVHDDFRVGFEAGNRLISSGCSDIGFIGVAAQILRSTSFVIRALSRHCNLSAKVSHYFIVAANLRLSRAISKRNSYWLSMRIWMACFVQPTELRLVQ